ncbi:MAG: AMP-binding protein [Candidatus Riflebacteria bacterium]|nr:AMP-binding protein [Candidatus Riflebacteria bacterium]
MTENNKYYIFGESVPVENLDFRLILSFIKKASDLKNIFSQTPIERILDVLEKVSKIWSDKEHPFVKKALQLLPEMIGFSREMVLLGIEAVSEICCRTNLEKRLDCELGNRKYTDSWVYDEKRGIELKTVPHGVLLHISAGNVFVGAIDSLISGIVTKNVNILKMSSADTLFPVLFLESIRESDPENIIWPFQCLINWRGGDSDFEEILFDSSLTVVFWGGKEALKSIRAKCGENIRFVENGPRFSFAVGDGNYLKYFSTDSFIRGLAKDISTWDQHACSSPHLVYLLNSDEKTTDSFIENLFNEMKFFSENLPQGKLDFDQKVEIRKIRSIAEMSSVYDSTKLFCPDDFSFSIIREPKKEFRISSLNRVIYVKNLDSAAELKEFIFPLSAYLQTVGICLSPELRHEVTEILEKLGVKRFTEWGGMSSGKTGAPHEGSFFLTKLVDFIVREPSDFNSYKLEDLFRELKKSPYYAKILNEIPPGLPVHEVLSRFPVMTRDIFYRISPPTSTEILTGPLADAYVFASGGTTGTPKYAFYSNQEFLFTAQKQAFIFSKAGMESTDRTANLFLAGNLWMSYTIVNRAIELIGCLNLPVAANSSIENIFQYLESLKASVVVGLPSMIVRLAEEAKKRNISLKIKKIFYAGEHMHPAMKEFLKEVFQAEIINSAGYACVDTGAIGYQCRFLTGSQHHVLDDLQYVEILDENQKPVGVDFPGEIIVTNLYRQLMPIVRYKTGDLGKWIENTGCQCGCVGRTFELLGRCDDLMVIGGITLLPGDVAKVLAPFPEALCFQISARKNNQKDVLILKIESEKYISEKLIIQSMHNNSFKLKEAIDENWLEIDIQMLKPGSIERNSRTGKVRQVIDDRSKV